MERIDINYGSSNIVLFIENNVAYGYLFGDCELDRELFNSFRLSNNYKYLSSCDGYQVILDEDTGLKHYYLNGIEDYTKLFYNNGVSETYYLGYNGDRIGDRRLFRVRSKVIALTLAGMLGFNNLMTMLLDLATYDNYSLDDIHNYIYSSTYLTDSEKTYLYNEDFFNDVLAVVNNSNYVKFLYTQKFNNINVASYEYGEYSDKSAIGYYMPSQPNILHVLDYNGFEEEYMDTVAHEFVHLCQYSTGYNLIIEACAEIISNEYFDKAYIDTYTEPVRLVKILMEIIGAEVIWEYNFTGDFSKIEDRVRPYLTAEEYDSFLNDLTFEYGNYINNAPKYKDLMELMGKIYMGIYNRSIDDDEIINLIRHGDRTLVRYYFNHRYMNNENSYYLSSDLGEYQTVSMEYATNCGMVYLYAYYKEPISVNEGLNFNYTENYTVQRDIDMTSNNIVILRRVYGGNKDTITAIINGSRFENVNLDDLVKDGYLKVDYYKVYYKPLSYYEYINKDYMDKASVKYSYLPDTVINDDNTVYGFVPKIVYLPTVNERGNNSQLVLKR